MKKKHTVHFVSQDKSVDLALCVFCKRLTDFERLSDCKYYADGYADNVCSGFLKGDNVSDCLENALNYYAK